MGDSALPDTPLDASGSSFLIQSAHAQSWGSRFAEVWRAREVLYLLLWRDVSVRYKQTIIGAGWAFLQPLVTMALFTVIFGHFAGIPSDGVPYPLFALCGLVPWQLFVSGLTNAANSLVASERLLTKVYFPRILVPLAALLAGLVDFAVSLSLLLIAALIYRPPHMARLLILPLLTVLVVTAALGFGLGLSALSVRYRDVRHTLPFMTQVWMFATPIIYPMSLFPPSVRGYLALNPMSAAIESFRWAVLGSPAPEPQLLACAIGVTAIALLVGVRYFYSIERIVADEI